MDSRLKEEENERRWNPCVRLKGCLALACDYNIIFGDMHEHVVSYMYGQNLAHNTRRTNKSGQT